MIVTTTVHPGHPSIQVLATTLLGAITSSNCSQSGLPFSSAFTPLSHTPLRKTHFSKLKSQISFPYSHSVLIRPIIPPGQPPAPRCYRTSISQQLRRFWCPLLLLRPRPVALVEGCRVRRRLGSLLGLALDFQRFSLRLLCLL
jgi:hypothetical protein